MPFGSSEAGLYLRLGLSHIADLRGYDHLVFVAALTVAYPASAWRRLLVLVTAFTVGHSVTLALATTGALRVPTVWIEAAIPATIAATAGLTLWRSRAASVDEAGSAMTGRYLLAAGFGLVHGLGFSNYLRSLLGGEESLLWPLLAFNAGLEVGQVMIVAAVMGLGALAVRGGGVPERRWVQGVSMAALLVAVPMVVQRTLAAMAPPA
ncbi:MAG: HupE/UreJ family protein [Gemmatimonadota bacterium]|jgi:hypothetical protein|nr:HupE/UreJ family protein [Gemmatimonadota bacterium]